jgi:octopine/nopaline transport system ATP-binding protein
VPAVTRQTVPTEGSGEPRGPSAAMRFSPLVARITGEGAGAWRTHYEAVAAAERGEDVIILSVGDPPLEAPQPVIERAIEQLRSGDTHYTTAPGRTGLREAVARVHTARTGQRVDVANVVCLPGTQNALFAASVCIAGTGDEVITFDPVYPTYPAALEVGGARMLRAPTGAGFRPDLDELASLITPRTRAIFWATPNNPTGVILSEMELDRIAELALRHDLWLVSDEVYAGLAPLGRVPSLAARLPERVITVGSLSKTHAMAGFRAGWLIGPLELARHVEALVMCMLFGMPGFVQEAAITALEMGDEPQRRIREFCKERLERFVAGLEGVAGLALSPPQAGMFLLIDVSGTGMGGREFMRALYGAERVSVLDAGAFGASTASFVRVCFAMDERTIDEGCARIRRFCERLPQGSALGRGITVPGVRSRE